MPASSLRLFFALWPDAATRVTLFQIAHDIVAETGGRPVAAENLHLTLAFLGERPAAMLPDLCASVSAIEVSPGRLFLDDVGCWRKTGIAWLAGTKPATQLLALRERVVQALASVQIVIDERRFMPHVTLARRVETLIARQIMPPIEWQVDSFALVVSTLASRGVRYEVLQTFGLTAARDGP
ncbi:MAG: RNA 2',3'-cyclic phosphodiesterase [Betaproteobacteria bacterium]